MSLVSPSALPPSLALLNVSSFLPNQIFFAFTCAATCIAIRLWTHFRARPLWRGPFRTVALVNLWMAFTIALFAVSGLVPQLEPWQPTIHMFEEVGTMGAFCYLAFKLTDLLPTVATRRSLEAILKASPLVFGVCWGIAADIGWRDPFPMTGLFVELPAEAFAYRAALLVPGLFYTGLISVLFSLDLRLAKSVGADPAYVRRMSFFFMGSLTFCVSCADHLAWAYLQVFGAREVVHLVAPPQVALEDLLWLAMGLTWMLGIVSPPRESSTDQSIAEYRRFLRRLRLLKTDLLISLPERVPNRRSATGYLRDAAGTLGLYPEQASWGAKVFEVVTALSVGATDLGRNDLLDLADLYERLLKNLPEDTPERENLRADPLPPALRPATRLTGSRPPMHQDLLTVPAWAQLGYLAADDLGLLPSTSRPRFDPTVKRAYDDAKISDQQTAF